VAKYYSPNGGKAIQDGGVTPGVVVNEPEVQVDIDENGEPIPGLPEAAPPPQKKAEDDPVVKKALEVLGVKA
jgi:C-terminal processing protease CtpA/Prc